MLISVLPLLEWTAVLVFALTGALVASRKEMDIFGFALLATVTGIGGGTLRDVLLGRLPVFWVAEPGYVLVCVGAAVVAFFTAHIPSSRYRLLLWLDALGLSLVAVVGADKALEAGTGPLIAVVMGVITATFGGIIRDMLGAEVPLILRRDIYVTAALAGATVYVGAATVGLPKLPAMAAGFAAAFLVRALALVYRWSLPAYRSRPGRSASELDG